MEKQYKYLISCIIPAYNVEKYIEESVDSIIRQTIGFKENIQLIIVDDGSTDNTRDILTDIGSKYDNIKFISKLNGGVSSARNEGLKHIEGKYVSFLDADDIISENTYELVVNFFEANDEKLNVVSFPMHTFESHESKHILNYKFKSSRVINLNEDFDCIQLSASSSMFKSRSVSNKQFDSALKIGEDAKFVNSILIEYPFLGVVKDARYYYRKRIDGTSAVDNVMSDETYFCDFLTNKHLKMIDESLRKNGELYKFTQYHLIYAIQWHLFMNWDNLDEIIQTQEQDFIKLLKEVVKFIDIDVILRQRNMNIQKKCYLLMMKHSKEIQFEYNNGNIVYIENNTEYIVEEYNTAINILQYKDNKLQVGLKFIPIDGFRIVLVIDNITYEPIFNKPFYNDIIMNVKTIKENYCYFEIDMTKVKNKGSIRFFLKNDKEQTKIKNFTHGKYSFLRNLNNYSAYSNNYMFTNNKRNKRIQYRKCSKIRFVIKNRKSLNENNFKLNIKTLFLRDKKRIWLISDRLDVARDNGEALFEYICKNKTKYQNIRAVFVLAKDSVDIPRMEKIGEVVINGSNEHKELFLKAEKVISSHAEEYITNPLLYEKIKFKRWYNHDFVFLQHGVTKDDISGWLNKPSKNISMLSTTSTKEMRSFIDGDYLYTDKEIKLVGFCRFDKLKNNSSKKIIIFPTWRKQLLDGLNPKTGKWIPNNERFINSEYYNFYSSIVNDSNLKTMVDNGADIELVLHPNFSCYTDLFLNNKSGIKIHQGPIEYSKLISDSACMITDYSSIVFDFAYLKKAIIYAHFDDGEIFESNYKKGYFDYSDDGFGPVCKKKDELVTSIISIIENDYKIEDKYLSRIEDFYENIDTNNCERTVKALL